jgi:hypothetical protein
MNPVSDQELLLFHYRDGMDAGRVREIEDQLFFDAELRLRLARMRELLAAVSAAPIAVTHESDAELSARLWSRIEPALAARPSQESLAQRVWRSLDVLRAPQFAVTSALLVALAVGYLLGQNEAPLAPRSAAPLLADDASARVLASYLASHLDDAERALLVASHSPSDAPAASALAQSLLDSNRLYAMAAERAGKPALGQFLRELEPVLIELANEQGVIAPALAEEIERRDLTFKTRAAAALARNEFAAPPLTL